MSEHLKYKAKIVPYSSTVGTSLLITDETDEVVAIVPILIPDSSRDYRSTAEEVAKRLRVGFMSARERLANIKKGLDHG